MANPRTAWGIDIGNRALKAVKLARQGDGVVIQDIDVIEHENLLSNAGDNRDQLIQTALAVFTSKHNDLKGAAAAVGVSGQQSFARFIKLPPVEEKKIPEIVRFEAIQQIPFPLEDVEWAYQLFRDESSPEVEVGLFAMRKELVNQHLGFFTAAGLNVQAVQMNPLADYNALFYDEKFKGATMVIDLGAENADLIIAEGENVWMRSIPIGGNHFTETLVRDFKLRFERAEELKRTTATSPHGRRILQAMRSVFADLVSEIQRSIGFYSSTHRDSRITRVIALGGTFQLPGLQKYLQQNLGLEVVKHDSIGQAPPADARVAGALNENILSIVSAYGLALQALGEAKIKSSLLPLAIQKERVWREKTKWFGAAAAMFVIGSTIPFVVAQNKISEFDSVENKAARSQVDEAIRVASSLDRDWKAKQDAGGEDRKRADEIKTLAEYHEIWPSLYEEVSKALPQSKAIAAAAADSSKSPVKKAGGPASRPATGSTPTATPTAVPGAPALPGVGAALVVGDPALAAETVRKFGPRNERAEVILEDLEVEYVPHIGDLVAKDATGSFVKGDELFNQRAGQRQPTNLAGIKARHGGTGMNAPAGGGAGFPVGMGDFRPPMGVNPTPMGMGVAGPGPMPPPGGDPNVPGGAPAGPDRRGYLLTLHLTTPNKGGIAYVQRDVVNRLNGSEADRQADYEAFKAWVKAGSDESVRQEAIAAFKKWLENGSKGPRPAIPMKGSFTIARVTIPSAVPLKDDVIRKQALVARNNASLQRKAKTMPQMLNVPGVTGAAGNIDIRALMPSPTGMAPGGAIGAPMDFSSAPGGFGAPAGGAGGVSDADIAQLLVDPVTGEDVRNDFIITVLVAVVLDPFETPAGPDGSDPSATPPGGSQ